MKRLVPIILTLGSLLAPAPALAVTGLTVETGTNGARLTWGPDLQSTQATVCWKRKGQFWGACAYNSQTVLHGLPVTPPALGVVSDLDCGTEYVFRVKERWTTERVEASTSECRGGTTPTQSSGCSTTGALGAGAPALGLALWVLLGRRRRKPTPEDPTP